MTIADKLTYLGETKDLLADAINGYTKVISADTPFREYAQWIDNIVFSAEGGIASLFDGGESGFAWSSLPYYQDPAGTTEAAWGNPVGLIEDATDNGVEFTQATVTARPILRNDPPRLEFDLVDDSVSTTLPAITNGTVVIAGTNGIWIDDDFNHAGGAFTIGTDTYTNGPSGILDVVGDLLVGGCFVIERQLTAEERTRVITKLKSMGAPGVFGLGDEQWSDPVINAEWTDNGGGSYTFDSPSGAYAELAKIVAGFGQLYLFSFGYEVTLNQVSPRIAGSVVGGPGRTGVGKASHALTATGGSTTRFGLARYSGGSVPALFTVSGISLKKLELIP